jgi:hypothetical protein
MSNKTLTGGRGTLTERYVHEVVRRVPADQRDDIADELRTTIAETIEGRGETDAGKAEREVLTEMGDPIRLAARYADRPLVLIGTEFYPAYVRLLSTLLVTVLPLVTAVIVIMDVLENNKFGSAIGAGIGGVLTVGAQIIAWLTVVFALIERVRDKGPVAAEAKRWTPDDLPDVPPTIERLNLRAAGAAVGNLVLAGLIVWQHTAKPYQADGERLQVIDPGLWTGWIWPILAGLVGCAVLEIVRAAKGRWNVPLAALHAVSELVFALPLAWVLYDQTFFNPEFLTAISDVWTIPSAFYTVTALVVLAIAVTESFHRFREALKK